MKYAVAFTKKAMKAFLRLPKVFQDNIIKKLDVLSDSPHDACNIKKLYGYDGCYRLRVGDYRVLYRIISEKVVIEIINVAHRREAYQ